MERKNSNLRCQILISQYYLNEYLFWAFLVAACIYFTAGKHLVETTMKMQPVDRCEEVER